MESGLFYSTASQKPASVTSAFAGIPDIFRFILLCRSDILEFVAETKAFPYNPELMMIDDQIAKRIRIIQRMYLGLTCFALFIFLSGMVDRIDKESLAYIVNSVIFAIIYLAAYLGLRKQRDWSIPLILITSIIVLVQTVPAIIKPAADTAEFISKVIQFFLIYFYWYQAFFFSREEVRRYFGSRGFILF